MGWEKKYRLILANDFKVWRFWNVFEYMVYITLYMYMFVFSIFPERGRHEQAQSAWTEAFLSECAR